MAFPIIIRLKYRGKPIGSSDADRPEGVAIRAWRAVLKLANRAMAYHWHEKYSQLHFGSGAKRRYGDVYKTRTTNWLADKLGIKAADVNRVAQISPADDQLQRRAKRMKARQQLVSAAGGANYNVFSGNLQAMVKNAVFRAFPSRFSIMMPAPVYVPGRRKDPTQPDIRAELTTVLKTEVATMVPVGQKVLTQEMKKVVDSGRVPISGD